MRIRDGRVTYNVGAKNKDFPISIGIFSWAEGVWYEKKVFVFIRHTLWQKFVCILKNSSKISKNYSAKKNQNTEKWDLGVGFLFGIYLG